MNIMLNQVCNLACPYCFANEFVGRTEESLRKDKSQISIENFRKALDFAIRSGESRIGLIGGEPLLHPSFEELVEMSINSPIPTVHLFTNGVYLDKYFNLLGSDKFTILINVNGPEDIGEKQYKRIVDNIEYLVNRMYAGRKISLGINIYKEDMDYGFILNLLKKYPEFNRLRLAITVPNSDDMRKENSIEYFSRMKDTTFKLFRELDKLGVMPNYDCNGMPICVTTEEEQEWLRTFWKYEDQCGYCNVADHHKCTPVLDVLPNLDVIRCFGMSDVLKVNMNKFETTKQIRGYFEHEIDSLMNILPANEECNTCMYKNTTECNGGCLAFKLGKFDELKQGVIKDFMNKEVI